MSGSNKIFQKNSGKIPGQIYFMRESIDEKKNPTSLRDREYSARKHMKVRYSLLNSEHDFR